MSDAQHWGKLKYEYNSWTDTVKCEFWAHAGFERAKPGVLQNPGCSGKGCWMSHWSMCMRPLGRGCDWAETTQGLKGRCWKGLTVGEAGLTKWTSGNHLALGRQRMRGAACFAQDSTVIVIGRTGARSQECCPLSFTLLPNRSSDAVDSGQPRRSKVISGFVIRYVLGGLGASSLEVTAQTLEDSEEKGYRCPRLREEQRQISSYSFHKVNPFDSLFSLLMEFPLKLVFTAHVWLTINS